MKLWHISQTETRGYDVFDSAVVAAETVEEARDIVPGGYHEWGSDGLLHYNYKDRALVIYPAWARHRSAVVVRFLGEAAEGIKKGEICSSFNAG